MFRLDWIPKAIEEKETNGNDSFNIITIPRQTACEYNNFWGEKWREGEEKM